MSTPDRLSLFALPGLPLVEPGDDLVALILAGVAAAGERLQAGDILVIAQKIVSKAEGRYAVVDEVVPSPEAEALAATTEKDPRLVELILSESNAVVRHRPGVVVVEHRHGYVMANAGIDASNVAPQAGAERVLLLPEDPDASAARLRAALEAATTGPLGVVINDSVGRAWRNGTVGLCLGSAGLPALDDLRGEPDLFGRPLMVSTVGLADELSAAASLLQGQGDEGRPVVVIRGLEWQPSGQSGQDLIRAASEDLFR